MRPLDAMGSLSPFHGLAGEVDLDSRALPWALSPCPFGAQRRRAPRQNQSPEGASRSEPRAQPWDRGVEQTVSPPTKIG